MVQHDYVGDYKIQYEDTENDISSGYYYLKNTLPSEESKVFFEYARQAGQAPFRSNDGYKFTLTYQYTNGESIYLLISKN